MEHLVKLLRDSYDLQEEKSEETAYWHLQKLRSEIKQLTLTDVSGMFSEKQMEEAWTDGCGCGESRSGYFDIENYT